MTEVYTPTTEDLILEWLQDTGRKIVSSHELQCECPGWLFSRGMARNPATIDRKWRKLRETVLKTVEVKDEKSRECTWEIISLNGMNWNSIIGGCDD